jgi:hypothetical protein
MVQPPSGERMTDQGTQSATLPPIRSRRRFDLSAAWAAVSVALISTGAPTSWKFGFDSGGQSASTGPSGTGYVGGATGTVPHGLTREYADNRNGSPVFASPAGAPAPGYLSKIPFNTAVDLRCFAPDASGMKSVTGFYLIGPDTKWRNLYVVADTMSNGGRPENTSSPNVDPRVPRCR